MNGNKRYYGNNSGSSSSNIPSSSSYPDSMNSSSSGSPPSMSSIDTSLYSQHEELIRFITDSWNKVCHQYNTGHSSTQVKYYNPDNNAHSTDLLKHFTPVDLEALWGRRLHHNLVQRNSQPF